MWKLVLLAALPLLLLVSGQEEIKTSLAACLKADDLNSCLSQLVEKLRPYMKTGLPDFNVPRTEPMFIPSVNFNLNKPPAIDVTAVFTDNNVVGLSTFKLNSINADKQSQLLTMSISVPELTATGNYDLAGQAVVQLPQSKGTYKTVFQDVLINGQSKVKVENGKLVIDGKPSIDVDLGNMVVAFDNLFDGQAPGLADTVHQFVNKDPKKFLNDFKPEILKQVSGLLKGFYTTAISGVDPAVFGL